MRSIRLLAILFVLVLAISTFASAQHEHMSAPAAAETLYQGLGEAHHPVKTSNAEAQKFFDQGMSFVWGFNHDEALKSFQRAAELDPKMAMAQWGIAYAVGPNYNLPVDEARELQAYKAIQTALELSKGGPATERAYIEALAKRYTNDPKGNLQHLSREYSDAMREVKNKYPDDLDAATLFAESLMTLHPWKLWDHEGKPGPDTEECVATLESVLRRDPNHIGANHFYIHAVEASKHPDRALASANRLADLAPGAGHLVHMPAHIYIRTGDQAASVVNNKKAAAADEAFFKQTNEQGIYPMMYYTHNLHFIAVSSTYLGNYKDAMEAAAKIRAHVKPYLAHMPMLDGFNAVPLQIMVRFERWDDVMNEPQPDASLAVTTGMWHYARGMAFASKGDEAKARAELDGLRKAAPAMGQVPTNPVGPGNAQKMPVIAEHMIEARLAQHKADNAAAVQHLREAIAVQDAMDYTEPPDWITPMREVLGVALLKSGQAQEAEVAFREDLDRNPRNPRSLYGLMNALKAEGREDDASSVARQFEKSWQHADTKPGAQL
jgi:tetratricopeptide (TPR) repeat protein